ncbi:Protein ccc1 [Polyrhizophydium stewartii]|uniref:Protein ccc1 n=1 Tax=Polyrhizophydium stewartii TaxID=2732419 RepID=A0ABR4MV88_9FUNG
MQQRPRAAPAVLDHTPIGPGDELIDLDFGGLGHSSSELRAPATPQTAARMDQLQRATATPTSFSPVLPNDGLEDLQPLAHRGGPYKAIDSGGEAEDGTTSMVDVVRDVIIGLSDGLTVPFALAAGLAALNNSKLVVLAGLAEIAAGSISMGLGGYLAGLSEQEYFDNQRDLKSIDINADPEGQRREIFNVFAPFGVSRKSVQPLVEEITMSERTWLDFVMKFNLALEKPSKWRALMSALTIGASYFCGGLLPLTPYMLVSSAQSALRISVIVTITALFLFGFFKARVLGSKTPLYSAVQMVVIGGLAAFVAYWVASSVPGAENMRAASNVADGLSNAVVGAPVAAAAASAATSAIATSTASSVAAVAAATAAAATATTTTVAAAAVAAAATFAASSL